MFIIQVWVACLNFAYVFLEAAVQEYERKLREEGRAGHAGNDSSEEEGNDKYEQPPWDLARRIGMFRAIYLLVVYAYPHLTLSMCVFVADDQPSNSDGSDTDSDEDEAEAKKVERQKEGDAQGKLGEQKSDDEDDVEEGIDPTELPTHSQIILNALLLNHWDEIVSLRFSDLDADGDGMVTPQVQRQRVWIDFHRSANLSIHAIFLIFVCVCTFCRI